MITYPSTNNNKTFGLNLLRFGAVFCVVLSHWYLYSPKAPEVISQMMSVFGFLGAEVLLVLCGFLLGRKVLHWLEMPQGLSFRYAMTYLKERAWRLLPLYYLVLVLIFAVASVFGFSYTDRWKYLFFLQNFASPMPSFFPESWLPAVVFYGSISLMLGFTMLARGFPAKRQNLLFLIFSLFFIALSISFRVGFYLSSLPITIQDWDQQLKSVVIYRLDSFYIGVLFSWISITCSYWWNRFGLMLLVFAMMLFLLLFVGVGYFGWLIESQPFFWEVWYLPSTSLAVAFLLPFASQWQFLGFLAVFADFGRKISYALFMIHYSVLLFVLNEFFQFSSLNHSLFCFASVLYFGIAVLVSFVLYRFYQNPLFRWGSKF